MPDTLTGWALFAFYTLGSAGGIGFLVLFAVYEIPHWWRTWRDGR